jgi:hypothetical protein
VESRTSNGEIESLAEETSENSVEDEVDFT